MTVDEQGTGHVVSRRRFLAASGAGVASLAIAGYVGYRWPHGTPAAAPTTSPEPEGELQSFVSRPDLLPPRVKLTHYTTSPLAASPRFILVAPRNAIANAPGQAGLMLIDRLGRLVWFQPVTNAAPFDFNAQSLLGKPMLTWWQGHVVDGYGVGTGEMTGEAYSSPTAVRAASGLQADLHELQLTPQGTALITAYQETTADLSSVGGPTKGRVLAGHAQEIELPSGKLVSDWDSLSHVALSESHVKAPTSSKGGPYDYFHINSIGLAPDGNLLISSRNTWALYKVDRTSGKILWRLNGKKSDFSMGKGAAFYWQHHARYFGPSALSVFDDGGTPAEEAQSRAILLNIDESSMQASLRHAYLHPAAFLAANQGSVQVLSDGRVFVGWGNQPYFSEFAADGTLLMDGEFPIGYRSYRAFTSDWEGAPTGKPAIAVEANPAGGSIVYASWNGATEIDTWTVLSGKHASTLEPVGSQGWGGFETAIAVNSSGGHFAVVASDSQGKELGRSPVVAA